MRICDRCRCEERVTKVPVFVNYTDCRQVGQAYVYKYPELCGDCLTVLVDLINSFLRPTTAAPNASPTGQEGATDTVAGSDSSTGGTGVGEPSGGRG